MTINTKTTLKAPAMDSKTPKLAAEGTETPRVDALVALSDGNHVLRCSKESFLLADDCLDLLDCNVIGSFIDLARTIERELTAARKRADEMRAERDEAIKREVENWQKWRAAHADHDTANAVIAELRAERDALKKDVESMAGALWGDNFERLHIMDDGDDGCRWKCRYCALRIKDMTGGWWRHKHDPECPWLIAKRLAPEAQRQAAIDAAIERG